MESIFYGLLAILGLGFLVFIHELGHYWVARRQGMRVEAFAIGFGKPIFTWERDGVKWHICWLPFGGYVKIAGMQKEGSREPYEIADGFFGKRPWQRIQVALAGPVVNIIFSVVVFTFLWILGGRDKPFTELTRRIGWVDPKSTLYQKGVRPGDVIDRYDNRNFNGFRDLLVASIMSGDTTRIQGHKIDYSNGEKAHFDYTLKNYDDPRSAKDKFSTIGVIAPAQYLVYEPSSQLSSGFPMEKSGIESGDRLLWADGEVLFSQKQLSTLINESTVFLTAQRGDTIFQTKIPRVQVDDLKMSQIEKAEIDDWQHESGLKGRLQDLYFIPYNLSPTCAVESRLDFIDQEDQKKAFQKCQRCAYFNPLEEGDQILAVDGRPVATSYELLQDLQTRRVLVIVERDPSLSLKISWNQAETQFDAFSTQDLHNLVSTIGTDHALSSSGHLAMLNPVIPAPLNELPLSPDLKARMDQEFAAEKSRIESIQDPQKRSEELQELEKKQKKLVLGIPLHDRAVLYNPTPGQQFVNVFQDTWRTLYGLVSGVINPKYVSGPVGIVHVVHQSWMVGVKEALFWMAVISLNLGFINLLPIPVLDGGHIMFSLLEIVTRKPLKAKTMERLIIPFVGLLVALFIYITYQDITRLFSKFF